MIIIMIMIMMMIIIIIFRIQGPVPTTITLKTHFERTDHKWSIIVISSVIIIIIIMIIIIIFRIQEPVATTTEKEHSSPELSCFLT